jgi:hypothetical protein
MDAATVATIASVISAYGVAMLFFRIQRELYMHGQGERVWLPVADWLLVAATLMSLLLVLVPLVSFSGLRLPAAASGAAAILVAGYVFAILAHYRILFGRDRLFWGKLREGPRDISEPSESIVSIAASALALGFFLWRLSWHD